MNPPGSTTKETALIELLRAHPALAEKVAEGLAVVAEAPAGLGAAGRGGRGEGMFAGASGQTVTAVANSGYVFTRWMERGRTVSTSPTYSFTLGANRSLTAAFSPLGRTSAPATQVNISELGHNGNRRQHAMADMGKSKTPLSAAEAGSGCN